MAPGADLLSLTRDVLLVVLMGVACWTDIHTRKIKNWLTLPTMGAGIVLGVAAGTWWSGPAGIAACLLVCLPLWRIGPVLSAGDVKMLMAAGALLGPGDGLRAVLWTLVCGLPAGILALLVQGRLRSVPAVLRGKAPPTMLWHAPVVSAGILIARLQPWPAVG